MFFFLFSLDVFPISFYPVYSTSFTKSKRRYHFNVDSEKKL